jgi:acyl carrier protein
MDVKEKIIALLNDKLGYEEAELGEDKDLVNDLGFDSLDMVEIIMGIEEKFGLKIEDSEVAGIKTVGDLIRKAEELTQNK